VPGRIAVLFAVLTLAFAAPAAAGSSADLRITVWPNGKARGSKSWTLRCDPAGGNLPNRLKACRTLARLRAPFAPVPPGVACSDIYGGPAVAHVQGRFRGRPVEAWFNRTDGCEVARWNAVRVLFPVGYSSRG
jgi:hypothetical protein